jgi:hypothetical protein
MIGVLFAELTYGFIHRSRLNARRRELSPAERWAVAAAANLARVNSSSLVSLHTTKLPMTNRHILRNWWNVHDAVSLESTLAWLKNEGHRTGFQAMHQALAGVAGPAELEGADPDERALLAFVHANHARFKNGDIVAWDFTRVINVARWGFSAGYISEGRAWSHALEAARVLQREYDSWAELSDNFFLGRRFWSLDEPMQEQFNEAAHWLQTDPASPWQQLAWRTPLG